MVGTCGREDKKYLISYKSLWFLDNISFCVKYQNKNLVTAVFESKKTMFLEIATT